MTGELIFRRAANETWYVAMMRIAKGQGLEIEVEDHYKSYIAAGDTEEQACFDALNEWDCLSGPTGNVNGESS